MGIKAEHWNDGRSWDAYVQAKPTASQYHQWVWKSVIEETYGHSTHYLAATENGAIRGALPLVELKSWTFGHFLVSLPYFNYGGFLADSPEAEEALLSAAAELARNLGARHIELRQGACCAVSWKEVCAKVAMVVRLPKTPEEMMARLSGRLRNKVRAASKAGFEVRWGGQEMVPALYKVFAINMRNLGTPVYPRSWFENVMRRGGAEARILALFDEAEPVAATLITTFRNAVELPWIASSPEGRKKYSTVLLYWTALEWALAQGYTSVDLGRCTPGGGVYQFKRQWECEEVPLHWYYWLPAGVPVPELRPSNPRYRLAIRAWQKLPVPVANWLGPRISRSIP